ncbi:helicase-exonuclease AddAB subunit AddA [Acidaminobacter sp. JC074]|uniref:helicase-exonuclease AddAB subunit AddA n=1 Tax=Acidaminobacter sp. JC074 TaxID=2530199 RepID=UPI001F1088E3|nr:helicase-exonuclease AddAB subunit AddA [Acidaminobacter sp. JC074]
MPSWTHDQNEAIISRGSNLLVSAAAGSGKTAVLVERIIQLIIKSGASIDQMLIVTFTNAAASEMRERIVSALYEAMESSDSPFLREQVNKIQRASIMTLHSFCIGVVRNNAHFIDVDPGFKVGDTVELGIMASDVMDMILEDAYEEASEDFINFVEAYSENRQDKKVASLIHSTYQFIQSQPEPIKWLKETVDKLDEPDLYLDILRVNISFDLDASLEILESAATLTSEPDGPLEYDEMIQSDISHVLMLKEGLNDLDSFVDSVRSISHMRLKSIKKDRKEEIDPHLIDEVKSLRKQYKDILDQIGDLFKYKSVSEYIEDIKLVKPFMETLCSLVESYSDRFMLEKSEKNYVDFNDLEHLALKALDNDQVSDYYRKKFSHIFLDEYQDSNLVQETLIKKIKREDNVFLVGDVKQSIYKFRLADPSLFLEKYHAYSKESDALDRRIDLKKNFRSRKDVLEGINFLFESLMSESFGEMVYDDDAKLYTGIDFGDIEDASVEFRIIEGKYSGDPLLEELSAAEVEAKAISRQIKDLIGKQSYNRKKNEYFDIKYSDIVILMRAVSSWAPVFNDVFMKEGIPLFADFQGGYFDAIEIKMFVDFLRLMDNPYQDMPLLTVLRSPIFDFTTEELIKIRISKPDGFYYSALFDYEEDDEIKAKIDDMKSTIEDYQSKAKYMKLDEIIWKIMIDTGYYQYVGAMPGGKARQGNLRLLVDRAEQMDSSHVSLYQFIQTVDKMHKNSADMGTAKIIGESENVVRIMSIHKSKGLEFPVVILAGCGKKFNLRDAYQEVLLHKKLGIGPKYIDAVHRVAFDTLPKKLIKRQIRMESLAEEMRVLYVALTRAVDKLIMYGTAKDLESHAKKWTRGDSIFNLMNGQNYLDWMMMILSKHPVSKSIWAIAEKSYLGLKSHDANFSIHLIKRDDLFIEASDKHQALSHILSDLSPYEDKDYEQVLESAFNFEYPYQVHELPSKFSVTELKQLEKGGIKVEPLNTTPKFLLEETPKSAAEIGTLTHFIMQKLDRKNPNIQGQIDRMVESKVIDAEDIKYIRTERFVEFFNSDLGKRYIASNQVFKEKPFVLKKKLEITGDDDILIQGIIDCYFEDQGEIVLLDYKTDYLYGDGDILVERYKTQLDLYKEAIEAITGKRVKETYIYSFFKNKAIPVE